MNRFQPLDYFRGITVCFMIIVNTPGDWNHTFIHLLHAPWHGFTPTDLVFPSFLFAVGNAISFAIPKWNSWTHQQVIFKIVKRTILIFLIGYLMYWFPFFEQSAKGNWIFSPFTETRYFGVLQRIALCYFAASLMIYYLPSRHKILWISGIILLLYWVLLALFGDYESNSLPLKVDQFLFADSHLYQGYGYPFDPEGLLSTLPAIVNVLAGFLAGSYVKESFDYKKLGLLFLYGCTLLFIGYLWHPLFPINKSLWTSSFVLLTTGLDLIILGMIIYFTTLSSPSINLKFFDPFGKNPLVIYVFASVFHRLIRMIQVDGTSIVSTFYNTLFTWMNLYMASLVYALLYTFLCWCLAKWMDIKKIYIKV